MFDSMKGQSGSEDRIVVTPLYSLDAEFCDVIRRQIEEIVPALISGVAYTLEELCGEEFWSTLSVGQCRYAGRCMAWLVTNNRLPLCFAPSRHEFPKYYRLK
jgi:hypothetical protein